MTTLSKAEYLQRYLSSGKVDEEKKKKKKKTKETSRASGMRIVEDDAFLSVSAKFKDVDSDEEKEDIAIITSISKQVEAKAREAPRFRSSFKPLDDVQEDTKPVIPERNNGHAGRNSSDSSPPQKTRIRHDSDNDYPSSSQAQRRHDSDSDQSPPRRNDLQPNWRKKRHDSDQSPMRESSYRQERRAVLDASPPRRRKRSSPRKGTSDSDQSPPRKNERSSKRDQHANADSAIKKHGEGRRRDCDSDQSPPRKRERSIKHADIKVEVDSDQSPPRKERSEPKRMGCDSDQSPPNKREQHRRRHDSDSDQSPPRRRGKESPRIRGSKRKYDSDESPPRRREPERGRDRRVATPERLDEGTQRTLDGKVAGLQSADDLKKETEKIRQREAKMFEEMDASVSGRYADTTVRQKQVRKGREKPEDKERKEREAKKQAELQEKYELWNKGMSQAERREQQLEEMARVAAEPLARMADDEEMNRHLKEAIHEEDPMAEMLLSKKREAAIDRGELVYPMYQGECPPNRFGIRPGYRWDGVDRSNGFEARLAHSKNRRQAQEREYYQNIQLYE